MATITLPHTRQRREWTGFLFPDDETEDTTPRTEDMMALYLYDADARDCVSFPTTMAGYNAAVDASRTWGGFLRDTIADVTDTDAALDWMHRILRGVGTLERSDRTARVFDHIMRAYQALDRQDWPAVNTSAHAAAYHLNLAYAEQAA